VNQPGRMVIVLLRVHFFPGLCLLLLGLSLQLPVIRWLLDSNRRRGWIWLGAAASSTLLVFGYLFEFQRVLRHLPAQWWSWVEGASVLETMCLIGLSLAVLIWNKAPQFDPSRRKLLQAAGAGLCIAPLAATGFGMVHRNRFRVSEIAVPIPNLHKDLDGLRIVQITDIHLSPFLSEREFAIAIDMANETRANIALVTGDLITRPGDPLDACLRQLARLRAEAGVLGCLGNHEVYTRTQDYVTAYGRRIGIQFLRHQAKQLRFGNAAINFAGVDYQRMHNPYLIGAERLIAPNALNVMLSHNPDVFPVAAAQGYDLTISGHTHGGQIDVEILHQHIDVARYFTPFVKGLYRRGNSSVYVSNGLGTIGVPVRLGCPPEVSVLRLCAISS
jgi:uncharacterized protein